MRRLSRQITFLSETVIHAGELAKAILNRGVEVTVKEGVPGGSHHSLLTEADEASQGYILEQIRSFFPGALILAEEECEGPDLIVNDNRARIKEPGDVIIVDAVDGTASASERLWDWSVACNWVHDGRHMGGVISAPEVRGGFHIVGEIGMGAILFEGDAVQPQLASVRETVPKDAFCFLGIDLLKRDQFQKFNHRVAKAVRTATVGGSCALATAAVASGRAGLIIQSQQWPWDWASVAIIQAAGGAVQFYHYRGGVIVPLAEPDLPAYNRSNRTTEGGLGFIAGAPGLVEWAFRQLQATFIPEGTVLPGV